MGREGGEDIIKTVLLRVCKRISEKRRDGKGMREEEGWKGDERRGGMERG